MKPRLQSEPLIELYQWPVLHTPWNPGRRSGEPDRQQGHFKKVLEDFDLVKTVDTSQVVMEPAGVVGIFTPWNSSAGSIAIMVAPAIAAGWANRHEFAMIRGHDGQKIRGRPCHILGGPANTVRRAEGLATAARAAQSSAALKTCDFSSCTALENKETPGLSTFS